VRESTFLNGKKLPFYFLISLQFLTCIPTGYKRGYRPDEIELANSTLFFPAVGLIIGGIIYLIWLVFSSLSPLIISALILTGWVYMTGGLHLDGFADTIDGLSGGKSKQEILDIMKDVHPGAKGTIGIVILVLIKFALITGIVTSLRLRNLVYVPVLSRWSMLLGCYLIPYAREQGTARFANLIGYPQIIGATLITIISGIFLIGRAFLIPFISLTGFSLLWALYFKKKIGGFTGDTLGGHIELSEVMALLVFSFF